MTNNPSFRSTNARVIVYKNTTKGNAPEEYEIPSEFVSNCRVTWTISPEVSEAEFTIVLGNVISTSFDGGKLRPTGELFLGLEESVDDLSTKLSGAWCKIYIPQSDGPQTETMETPRGEFLKSVPSPGEYDAETEPTTWKLIFVGKIWKPERTFGNLTQFLTCRAVDIGGYAQRTKFQALPKILSDGGYSPIPWGCLPDFNQLENGKARANLAIASRPRTTWEFSTEDYNLSLSTLAFSGRDMEEADEITNAFWTGKDIVDTCVQYLKTQFAALWEGIDVNLNWTDVTSNLESLIATVSSRGSIWEILNSTCSRERGLLLWWDYAGNYGTTSQVTLKVGFFSDAAVGGYTGLPTVAYTRANSKPVRYYTGSPVLSAVNNDDYYKIRVETEPVNFTYTFNLQESFTKGWRTDPEDEETDTAKIRQGGAFAKYYSRFTLKLNELYKISSSDIRSGGFATEPWGGSTAVGVKFGSNGSTLTNLSVTNPTEYLPFEQTVKISPTIPISDETGNGKIANSPVLFFIRNDVDDCGAVDQEFNLGGMSTKYGLKLLNNSITINPDADNIDLLKDEDDRAQYFLTLMVEGTPPLYVYANKDVINNEASYCVIKYPFKPTVVMNNTVIGIDNERIPILTSESSTGVAKLLDNGSGMTVQKLYNDMKRFAEFFAKEKQKCDWEIGFINHDPLLAKFISTIEIPEIIADPASPGQEFITVTLNTLVTKIVWDLASQTTQYYTDFSNFIKIK